MPAGASAEQESLRQRALAEAHTRAAHEALATAGKFAAASVAERRLARALSPLAAHGYYLLPDRQWPGSKTAQVDLVLVGPSGVFIIDSKHWNETSVAAGRMFRGQDDVTDEVENIADLAYGTEAVLAQVGLAPGEVRPILAMANHRGKLGTVSTVEVVGEDDVLTLITSRGTRLTTLQVETVLTAVRAHFPPLGAPQPVNSTVPEPVLREIPDHIEEASLISLDEIEQALIDGQLAAPIEEWMTFLHPDQAKLVRRSFTGPSRIRGAAGTGKTVVGLHRAAYLARYRPAGKILVTTYVRTLPAVLKTLLTRLAPDVADRVEFAGVHQFARRILVDRGIRTNVRLGEANTAFVDSWNALSRESRQRLDGAAMEYWKEEVLSVIKGRGFTTFEQYADCARAGRKRTLGLQQRRAVWDLYTAYTGRLRAQGINDFEDTILLALDSLREHPMTDYSAVIVDEAQDLSCVMIAMLYSLVGDEPDGFNLIGDGQQSIYPGGYTLSEIGISIAGRGVVMDTNYRNTAEIVQFARSLVDGDEFADIEGSESRGDAVQQIPRHGREPIVERFPNWATHDAVMLARVREATEAAGASAGDVAILCRSNKTAARVLGLLKGAGIPSIELEQYTGTAADAVKVGTIKRSKGLEFKKVILPYVRAGDLVAKPVGDNGDREREERDRRELYVAITRARDGVWVGVTS